MSLRSCFTFFLLVFSSHHLLAQVCVKIEGHARKEAILVKYYGEQVFVVDTLVSNAKGVYKIGKDRLEKERLYGLVLPDIHFVHLDFIHDGAPIRMSTTSDRPIIDMKVAKGVSTEALYADASFAVPYLRRLNEEVDPEIPDPVKRDAVADLLQQHRAMLLDKYRGTLWAEIYGLDSKSGLPYYQIREFGRLMRERETAVDMAALAGLPDGHRQWVVLHPLYEQLLREALRPEEGSPEVAGGHLLRLLETVREDEILLSKLFQILNEELYGPRRISFEPFLIRAWDAYFSGLDGTIAQEVYRKTAALVGLLKGNRQGDRMHGIDVRNPNFERIGMHDILEGHPYTILIFWDAGNREQWEVLYYWRDMFNRTGLYSKGVQLALVAIHSDKDRWVSVLHDLNLLDYPNYLDWLNNGSTGHFYDGLVGAEAPVSYLVDRNGVILSKLAMDFEPYYKIILNQSP